MQYKDPLMTVSDAMDEDNITSFMVKRLMVLTYFVQLSLAKNDLIMHSENTQKHGHLNILHLTIFFIASTMQQVKT